MKLEKFEKLPIGIVLIEEVIGVIDFVLVKSSKNKILVVYENEEDGFCDEIGKRYGVHNDWDTEGLYLAPKWIANKFEVKPCTSR